MLHSIQVTHMEKTLVCTALEFIYTILLSYTILFMTCIGHCSDMEAIVRAQ